MNGVGAHGKSHPFGPAKSSRAYRSSRDAGWCPHFHFEEQRVQTLAAGVFIFGQPSLEQTSEAKSVAHTHRCVTVQALVRLARARGERIGEAVETHLREAQIVGARWCESRCGMLRTGSERTAEVAEFVLSVSRILHCLSHFIAQEPTVALPHAVK